MARSPRGLPLVDRRALPRPHSGPPPTPPPYGHDGHSRVPHNQRRPAKHTCNPGGSCRHDAASHVGGSAQPSRRRGRTQSSLEQGTPHAPTATAPLARRSLETSLSHAASPSRCYASFRPQHVWVHAPRLPPSACVRSSRAACRAQWRRTCCFLHSAFNRWNVSASQNGTGWAATSAPPACMRSLRAACRAHQTQA